MAEFSYIARDREGTKVEGTVTAPDRRAAFAQVERLGLMPVSLGEAGAGNSKAAKTKAEPATKKGAAGAGGKRSGRAPKLKLRDMLMLSREIRDLLSSGMTLSEALGPLAAHQNNPAAGKIVGTLRDKIIAGSSLSGALAQWPDTFSPLYVSMVRSGEASGDLTGVLDRVCLHYERVMAAREKVIQAMIYPMIIVVVGTVTIGFAMIFVVPRFAATFKSLNAALPLPTLMLINGSNFLMHWGWLVLIFLVAGVIGFRRFIHTPKGEMWWHGRLLKLPLSRHIIASDAYAQFARTLGVLMANGVPVLQALTIVEETMSNRVLAAEIHEARNRVTDGTSISGPLAAGKIFPPMLTQMLAVGEKTGDLSAALGHIARRYDEELDRYIKVFTSMLEPVMILIMALVVGFIAVSLLLAVFSLTSALKI
ncbi:MAG: type II secretion system F family protein [Kiritimatiellaeota bacterium]|nr:type II secretion system F family protein [Kiritimatiellota bacterium]